MTSNDETTPQSDEKNDAVAQAGAAINQMTQGEQLLGLGALIVVLSDLIGGILLSDYFFSALLWGSAVLVLVALWATKLRSATLPVSYNWVMVFLGYAGFLVGVRQVLVDISGNVFNRGGSTVVFALITYAAVALMGIGAYRVSKS